MPGKTRTRVEHSAGGVVINPFDGNPRCLLILDGNENWGFPKGHVDPGETAREAAVREIAEETGVRDLTYLDELGRIDWFFRFKGVTIHKYCDFFLFESLEGDAVPQAEEGIRECAWLSYDEALERLTHENTRMILRRAGDKLNRTR